MTQTHIFEKNLIVTNINNDNNNNNNDKDNDKKRY
jgi:hypothetical protein